MDSEAEEDEIHCQFKVILLGDGTVGKTSIATRFADDQFHPIYKQTIGVDFFVARLDLPPRHKVTLQIWDIGGQSIGSKMITNYISGAHAVLLCYDITNYESFANLEDWYRLVVKAFRGKPMPVTALVGNKNDIRHLCVVKPNQHTGFAEENGMHAFLMSAKSGDHVRQVFFKLASILAGIKPTKADVAAQAIVVTATVVDHQRHDPAVHGGKISDYNQTSKSKCTIS